jgi:hypothetical protein
MNAHSDDVAFILPTPGPGGDWRAMVDTTWDDPSRRSVHDAGTAYPLKARSLVLLIEHRGADRRGET